jgi:hypothetical protein
MPQFYWTSRIQEEENIHQQWIQEQIIHHTEENMIKDDSQLISTDTEAESCISLPSTSTITHN